MSDELSGVSSAEWLRRLEARGYRLTAPMRAVVETLSTSRHVLTPQELYDLARQRYSRLGLVTVYRTLEKLEELNLIQRVHQPDGCHAFVADVPGHKHLLICDMCGRVEYFSGDKLDGLMSAVGAESGYLIRDHWLQLFGLCGECR